MEEDGINSLPDCLLVDIISRLPSTKQAIRTSSLSKRWKHLWTEVSNLIFPDDELDVHNDYSITDYVSLVEKTLTQHRQQDLNKFQLYIPYYYSRWLGSKVIDWIRYAIKCKVQELDIVLVMAYSNVDKLVFDHSFFTNAYFTHLKLRGFNCLLNPSGSISWTNLRSLWISRGKLDDGVIQNILSGSPLLETLKLEFCYGFSHIDVPSKSLTSLVIHGYYDYEDSKSRPIIKINAPYIVSLMLQEFLHLEKVVLLNMSSLVQAHLDYYLAWNDYTTLHKKEEEEMLNELIQNLSHVKELTIGTSCLLTLFNLKDKGVRFPSNLKT